ncbi:sulfotransferase family protein [Actinomadura sp. WMMB 499]|uniref:sulfotransferase family protein n=1 Tax=Actinomadura sp. WMMB 499 TaxID=1219491 RepID=UPI001244B604|nr:sulfotransferase family protein [Actinomadura sp. WMMB 499]QFG20103.1 sulfotransferase family protein [Actinomadura sp. WMMB 499]
MIQIIGAGCGRTGTLSLKAALERLGFGPCHHMLGMLDRPAEIDGWHRAAVTGVTNWDELYRGYRATVDWPGARYWRELAVRFPAAKVILTERDPARWYESALGSIYRAAMAPDDGSDPLLARMRRMSRAVVWDGVFGGRFEDADHAMRTFADHNRAVRREIPADRLLVFEVARGWEPLCDFLGVPVPSEPFPHENDRAGFAARLAGRTDPREGG